MFDGVVRTLADVKYTPEMKKSLLSIGVFDSLDYTILVRDGVMRIIKGFDGYHKGPKKRALFTS